MNLLTRIDRFIYRLKGDETYWNNGVLTHPVRRDGRFFHGYEARSHFPKWLHRIINSMY